MLNRNNQKIEIKLDPHNNILLTPSAIKREFLAGYSYNIEVELLKIDPFDIVTDQRGNSRLLPINKPFHDRAIITNYNFVIAPGGLDLIEEEKSGKMTIVYGLFPDFTRDMEARIQEHDIVSFKSQYLYNNLYAIISNKGDSLKNPIIKQYMISFDYLWKKALDYRELIKKEEPQDRMDQACLSEIEHGDYNESTSTLEVWDKNELYKKENRIILWRQNEVLASSGSRSKDQGNLNQFINCKELLHNHLYYIDPDIDKGINGACYLTDELGRVVKIQVSLPFNVGLTRPTAGNNTSRVCLAKNGISGKDVGGHLIARSLNGPNEAINIVPMANNVNDNLIGGIERIIKGELEAHKSLADYQLSLDVTISYEDDISSFRPSGFRYILTEIPSNETIIDLAFSNI